MTEGEAQEISCPEAFEGAVGVSENVVFGAAAGEADAQKVGWAEASCLLHAQSFSNVDVLVRESGY